MVSLRFETVEVSIGAEGDRITFVKGVNFEDSHMDEEFLELYKKGERYLIPKQAILYIKQKERVDEL